MQSVSDYLCLYTLKSVVVYLLLFFPATSISLRTAVSGDRALGDETSGGWGDGTSMSCHPKHIPRQSLFIETVFISVKQSFLAIAYRN